MSIISEKQILDEYNQLNSFEICHQSQEIIQDLISKTSEALQNIRALSIFLLYGDQNGYVQRRMKLEEIFLTFDMIIKRLRVSGHIVYQRKLALEDQEVTKNTVTSSEPMILESNEDTTVTSTATGISVNNLECLTLEREKLKEELRLQNSYIKLAIDKINDIIWNINSIQTIKK